MMASTATITSAKCLRTPFGGIRPSRVVSRVTVIRPQASQNKETLADQVPRALVLGTAAATFLSAGNVQAAQEVADLAGDNRLGIIALLFIPVVGWVGFNILQPALNQLDAMSGGGGKAPKKVALKKRSVAAGLGLAAASLLATQNADAVSEVAQIAGDNRLGIIALLFVPVVGWVGFNILQPALNQLDAMSQTGGKKVATKKRGVAIGLALTAASLLYGESANAANEVAQVAADNRLGIIALLFLPVVGWVGFNILGPALNQLDAMSGKGGPAPKKAKKK
eukprot:jgi/Botrbrau1/23368/Bobra.0051s0021.2